MSSVVSTSNSQGSTAVAVPGNSSPKHLNMVTESATSALETPNASKLLGLTGTLELPSTAELMQKCLQINPFEQKFREANRRINFGPDDGLEPPKINLLGTMVSMPSITTSLQQSPSIFSNIGFLQPNSEGTDNITTADFSKLVSSMSEQAKSSESAAPRTADVLNAVLDMHHDRLHTINYLQNKPDLSMLFRSPNNSAPNSAGVLGLPLVVPMSTSAGLLAPPLLVSPAHSPRKQQENNNGLIDKQHSPGSDVSSISSQSLQPPLLTALRNLHQQQQEAAINWDSMDIKPAISKANPADGLGPISLATSSSTVTLANALTSLDSNRSRQNTSSEREITPTPNGGGANATPSRGRGRGRASLTADLPPDERRMTILERNKAAAVRYRKRKKEEHDDMITRVHTLEQDKVQLTTQNQVLRRELDRVTALLREREARCHCLNGLPLSTDLRSISPNNHEMDLLQSPAYLPQSILNGIAGMKRPKM
ncbi:hypothetical protein WR25_06222 [Diploscapter pachys]|uniref:BZIP domain-containing protein n=1 Tax=Diploscapter pachys TaxID=2018661 RepID=A0A2A2M068_9BILA|nr:hypothetical protein WR25_06222 [Diploscapter pachys]